VQWTCAVLSSGERTITTELASAGIKPKAGQLVRLLDIPVARRYSGWDNLHGFSSGAAFSDAIKRAVSQHHGHAGVAFLERLTRDHRDWTAHLESFKRLPGFVVGDSGQDTRAAARFALLAMAGELVTEYGVTGWAPGQATDAAQTMFHLWQSQR
jgi:putative DNA primase/helicase